MMFMNLLSVPCTTVHSPSILFPLCRSLETGVVKGRFMNVNKKSSVGEGITFINPIFIPQNLIWFWHLTFACLCVPSVLSGLVTGMTLLENGKEKSENFL